MSLAKLSTRAGALSILNYLILGLFIGYLAGRTESDGMIALLATLLAFAGGGSATLIARDGENAGPAGVTLFFFLAGSAVGLLVLAG